LLLVAVKAIFYLEFDFTLIIFFFLVIASPTFTAINREIFKSKHALPQCFSATIIWRYSYAHYTSLWYWYGITWYNSQGETYRRK